MVARANKTIVTRDVFARRSVGRTMAPTHGHPLVTHRAGGRPASHRSIPSPVIIEDEASVGSRAMVTEGARAGRGAMLERRRRGVPGCRAALVSSHQRHTTRKTSGGTFGFPCALIIRRFAEGERHDKATLNAVLREHGVAT